MPKSIKDVLGLDQPAASRYRRLAILSGVILLVGLLLLWWWAGSDENGIHYQTADVTRGNLTVTVTATGVIQPVNQVDVGTEISGMVKSVEVDFNDRVSTGQVLARLDIDQLSARLRQSRAALALAKAAVMEAEATLLETRVKLSRARDLEKKQLTSTEQVDTVQAAFDRARAGVERAKAQVNQAEAQVDADQTALTKAEIRSPIDGIVLKRQIEPGQTVAASLQTPVLFTLAENLAQMELNVAVDEADVGMVREQQPAIFRVDAYAERSFPARISQVRFAPQTVDGVVTYETILSVDNADLSLRPGMTATAEIIVQELKDVVLVPNSALRFAPATAKSQTSRNLFSQMFTRRPAPARQAEQQGAKQQRVWVLRDGQPVALDVKTGATDGRLTELTAGDIKPGTAVIIDTARAKK